MIEADVCIYIDSEEYIYFALSKTDASHTPRHRRLKEQQGGRGEGGEEGEEKEKQEQGEKEEEEKEEGEESEEDAEEFGRAAFVLDDTNEKATIICPSSQ